MLKPFRFRDEDKVTDPGLRIFGDWVKASIVIGGDLALTLLNLKEGKVMDELELHLGETVEIGIELKDAQGNVTTQFDEVRGVIYEVRNQTGDTPDESGSATVDDPDENPFDATLVLHSLTDQAKYLHITVDGKVGPEENVFTFRSQPFSIVEGEAVSGTVTLKVVQEPAPTP